MLIIAKSAISASMFKRLCIPLDLSILRMNLGLRANAPDPKGGEL